MPKRGFPSPIAPGPIAAYYDDAILYDYHHRHYRRDLAFYAALARQAKGPLLELGCGTGRLTLPMAREGTRIVAVDINPNLLDRLRRKLSQKTNGDLAERIEIVEADIAALDLGRRFPIVLMPFNTLMHFYDPPAIEAALATAKRHLASQGRFVFDVLNPDLEYLAESTGKADGAERVVHPKYKRPYWFSPANVYDAAAQINYAYHRYRRIGRGPGPKEETVVLKQRQFFPAELDAYISRAGFDLVVKYGDFAGRPFWGRAAVMICVCARAEEAGEPR
ncbi:MAG: class I SAM-dependent methyltransferase [Myxococcales bacterium]|nr:MAG: class I SAM-dependent methyltransferase [Myxococcales bacterium]